MSDIITSNVYEKDGYFTFTHCPVVCYSLVTMVTEALFYIVHCSTVGAGSVTAQACTWSAR